MTKEELKVHYEAIDKLEKIYEEKGFDSKGAVSIYDYYDINKRIMPEDLVNRLEVLLGKLDHLIAPELERHREIVEEKVKEYEGILSKPVEERLDAYVSLSRSLKELDGAISNTVIQPIVDLGKSVGGTLAGEYDWYMEAVKYSLWVKKIIDTFEFIERDHLDRIEERSQEIKIRGVNKPKYLEGCKMLDEMLDYAKQRIK
jgi:hypothetical protein|nr:MAG TPA: hypothetical protein [Caudoviricetes sp.]